MWQVAKLALPALGAPSFRHEEARLEAELRVTQTAKGDRRLLFRRFRLGSRDIFNRRGFGLANRRRLAGGRRSQPNDPLQAGDVQGLR